MSKNKGRLFIISGPSGCGKGTILEQVLKQNPNIFYSVSLTTREKRKGEIEGINYIYTDKNHFLNLKEENKLLEYTQYCTDYYGTPKQPIEENLNNGKDVILEIETDGAFQVKEKIPNSIMIFILPPSIEELEKRLLNRATDSTEKIKQRLKKAKAEIELSSKYEHIIINDKLEDAIEELLKIINNK